MRSLKDMIDDVANGTVPEHPSMTERAVYGRISRYYVRRVEAWTDIRVNPKEARIRAIADTKHFFNN